MEFNELMGHAPAKVDPKGRIKIPQTFRRVIEERWGPECFITSFDGQKAEIYPLPVWRDFQARLAKVPSTSTAKRKMLEKVNYFGHLSSIDNQGRLLVPGVLREQGGIDGDVVVLGSEDHLSVWNEQRAQSQIGERPLTDEDYKELELHGV